MSVCLLQTYPFMSKKTLQNGTDVFVGYMVELTKEMSQYYNFR